MTNNHQTGGSTAGRFRHDIQALRALAVMLVLVYHLWPDVLTGGYVGVDAFFVISGYLIAKHLFSEVKSHGTVRLGRFWARRAQRLLPASMLVLAATAVGIWLWVPLSLRSQFYREIVSSALLFENWQLASDAVDYLASDNAASPTQHFWTLSVEEQFYIGLPLIVMASARLGRPAQALRRIQWVLTAVVVASLVHSVMLTASSPGLAFFSTFTRAWEFSLGALFAVHSSRQRTSNVAAWGGIALLILAAVTFGHDTAMPGWAAALPVIGTLLVLQGGAGSGVDAVGRFAPINLIGRVSYSVYLWHWPLLIIAPYALGRSLGFTDLVLIGVLSILIAWASTDLIEDPIRFRPPGAPSRQPSTVAAWSIATIAVLVGGTLIVAQRHDNQIEALGSVQAASAPESVEPESPDEPAGQAAEAAEASAVAPLANCRGAAALDPDINCNPDFVAPIEPNPAVARQDDANEGQCWGHGRVCTVGETENPTLRVLAVGDSHNNSLIAVYRALGENNGWAIDVNGIGGCYLTTSRQQQPSEDHQEGCETWRASTFELATSGSYDAFLVTHSTGNRTVEADSTEERRRLTIEGLVAAWSLLPDVPIIAIRDNPRMEPDVIACVELAGDSAAADCSLPRDEALLFDGSYEAAAQLDNAHVVDLSDFFCTPSTCSPVIGNILVYQDHHHLTETYSRTMIPYYERLIVPILTGSS